jgi:hypothetical protein
MKLQQTQLLIHLIFTILNIMQASKAQKPFKMTPFSSNLFSMKEAPTIYQMNLVIKLGWSSS